MASHVVQAKSPSTLLQAKPHAEEGLAVERPTEQRRVSAPGPGGLPWSIAPDARGEAGRSIRISRPSWPLPRPFQAKLKIGSVDDPAEREADQLAEQVMRMPAPAAPQQNALDGPAPPGRSDLRGPGGEEPVGRGGSMTMRWAWARHLARSMRPRELRDALDAGDRDFFESRLGIRLGRVRVHTDADASRSAQGVNALAYTLGDHIVFGAGQYQPGVPRETPARARARDVVQQLGVERGDREPSRGPENRGRRYPVLTPTGPHARATLRRQTPPRDQPGVARLSRGQGYLGRNRYGVRGLSSRRRVGVSDRPGWGSAAHQWNDPGFDGVAFKTSGPFRNHIIDNKSWARAGEVGSATALRKNLESNLSDLIQVAADPAFNDVPNIDLLREPGVDAHRRAG